MRLIDRYIGHAILRYSSLVFVVLMGIFLFMVFIEELADVGVGSYDLIDVIRFVVLSAPLIAYQTFPMVALIGSILGLSSLASGSELIIVRASGVSMARITLSVLKIGAFFMITLILIGEFVNPWSESEAQRGRAESLQRSMEQSNSFGLWIRDGNKYINIGQVLPDLTLLQIRIFEVDEGRRLVSMQQAERGLYQDNGWDLFELRETLIGINGESTTRLSKQFSWSTDITPEMLSDFLITPDRLSIRQLSKYTDYLTNNGQDPRSYQLAYWQKIILPMSTAAMLVLSIPFVFGSLRSGTMGRNLFIGIMAGLLFHTMNKAFGYIVLGYGVPPFWGAILPTASLFLLAFTLYRRVG
ncbi:MAG: LPS export ABC transporter permease LptG [Acidiferrobacteraceae bacterium]|nr:LPS export ABC transporter permease LptG [Acidiferrobacteraceae bacterium]|tara:strand:+ start:21467 stop:22534 length:1068 start_codon:yes stop_codon:yes gene_type:complete